MSVTPFPVHSPAAIVTEPVAVIAPSGRDQAVTEGLLRSAGIAVTASSMPQLVDGVEHARFSAAIVAEEALEASLQTAIERAIQAQPPWSDFPFVVLLRAGRRGPSRPIVEAMQNVTEVQRPVHPAVLVATVRAALRARGRQHETQAHIDARRQAELELAGLAESLEQRVEERTRELRDLNLRLRGEMAERQLAEEQVRQVQAMLIHVSRLSAMDTMASTLAHELNQPLAAILNYTRGSERMLKRLPDVPAELQDAIAAAARNAHRAGTIIHRLRDLVTNQRGERQPASLTSLIDDARTLGLIDAASHGVMCRIEIEPAADLVLVDRIQVQQVIINLLRNAMEAMEQSERREVVIRGRRWHGAGIVVEISDTGPGLPATVREALFSPFTSTKSSGMGLGMSICRTIVEANGGRIWIERSSPEGTCVAFTVAAVGAG